MQAVMDKKMPSHHVANKQRNDYDTPWKQIIERYFQAMMEFLMPEVASKIDWQKPHEFLDQELLRIQRKMQIGKRITDKLVKVYQTDGSEIWVMIHIEIQHKKNNNFSERMFEYY